MSDSTLEERVEAWAQELIDWQYGTVYKQYDREETAETLADDVKERIPALLSLYQKELESRVHEEVGRILFRLPLEARKHLEPYLQAGIRNLGGRE